MTTSLVLIGHRACGKTTIGKKLAQRLERPFVDTDLLIEEHARMSIPEIFATYGEAYFRELEEEVVLNLADKGYVIATGGGTALNQRMMDYLKGNAKVIFIDVPKTELLKRRCADTRPLLYGATSLEEELDISYDVRNLAYLSVADKVVKGADEEILEAISNLDLLFE